VRKERKYIKRCETKEIKKIIIKELGLKKRE